MIRYILAILLLSASLATGAIQTLYFSTADAGAGDGTTWNDRAAFVVAGTIATEISSFDFSAGNSLICRVEGGNTYTLTTGLSSATWTNPPTASNALYFHGCDSSGNLLAVPDPDWTSAEPAWNDSALPVIATTTNISTTAQTAHWRLVKLTSSGRASSFLGTGFYDWCVITTSTNSTNASTMAAGRATNCVLSAAGTSYDCVVIPSATVINCRIIGNPSATTGSRFGMRGNSATIWLQDSTIVGNPGGGVENTNTAATQSITVYNCTLVDNLVYGIRTNNTASQTSFHNFNGNVLSVSSGTNTAVDLRSESRAYVYGNLLRGWSTAFLDADNAVTGVGNDINAAADNTIYADYAGGDFRISNTHAAWGLGYGVADEPAPAGGETSSTFSD